MKDKKTILTDIINEKILNLISSNSIMYISSSVYFLFSPEQNNLTTICEKSNIFQGLSSDKKVKILSKLKIIFKKTYNIVDAKKAWNELFIHIPGNTKPKSFIIINEFISMADFLNEEDGITWNIFKQELGFHSKKLGVS